MWGETERSPALAAPGSNNYGNVGNHRPSSQMENPPRKIKPCRAPNVSCQN